MKKAHLQFITGFLGSITTGLKSMPADMPAANRKPFDELNQEVVMLTGRYQAITPEDGNADTDAVVEAATKPLQDMLGLAGRVIAQHEQVINGMPEQIRLSAERLLNEKIASGEVVTKETATTLAGTAKAEGAKEARAAIELHAGRRQELVKCGLPAVEDAAILGLDQAAFTAAKDEAVKRDGELKGFKLPEAERTRLLFAKPEEYAGAKKTFESILSGAGVKPNPMLGGGGGDTKTFGC